MSSGQGDNHDPEHERESLIDLAIAEFLESQDSGSPFDLQAWLAKYPEYREELRQFVADQHLVTGRLGSGSGSGGSGSDENAVPSGSSSLHQDPEETQEFLIRGVPSSLAPSPQALGSATPIQSSPRGTPSTRPDRYAIPERVGEYQLVRLLGIGGMGQVHEGIDAQGNRVAVKLLLPSGGASAEVMDRFRQEGALASSIDHPRCVFVRATDEDEGRPYIVMELMSGRTLKDLVRQEGPLLFDQAIAKMIDVIDGLQAAHDRGLVHRDVKPANCYLEANGRVKIGDFGLARSMDVDAGLTTTGSFLGTPLFASPEQVRGEAVDARTDVYSVCATLYFLVTGQAPFESQNPTQVIARIVSDDPVPPSKIAPWLPKSIDGPILKGLQRDRERRYPDLLALRSALEPFVGSGELIAGRGRRAAAYAIDSLLFSLIGGLQAMALGFSGGERVLSFPQYLLMVSPMAFYFGLMEWWFGGTLGKLSTGLRVRNAIDGGAPSALRVLGRTVVYVLLSGMGVDLVLYAVVDTSNPVIWYSAAMVGYLVSTTALFGPALFSRRPLLIHDRVSHTRVTQLDRSQRRVVAERAPAPPVPIANRGELTPSRLGRFRIVGRLLGSAESSSETPSETPADSSFDSSSETQSSDLSYGVWGAEDRGLRRQVWIYVVPEGCGASESRKRCERTTRLRWLDGGDQAAFRWDAYLAPEGAPLSSWVREHGALEWGFTRQILESLLEESRASRADQTWAGVPTLDCTWLDRRGRTVVVDPIVSVPGKNEVTDEGESIRAIAELARTLSIGKTLPPSEAPSDLQDFGTIPLHARELLKSMSQTKAGGASEEQVAERLQATADRPTRVTPVARWIAVGLILAAMSPVIGSLMVLSRVVALQGIGRVAGALACMEMLERKEREPELAALVQKGVPAGVLAALDGMTEEERQRVQADLRDEYARRLGAMGMFQLPVLAADGIDAEYPSRLSQTPLRTLYERPLVVTFQQEESPRVRLLIDGQDWNKLREANELGVANVAWSSVPRDVLIVVGVWFGIMTFWGGVFRGGWCLTWAGIRVVDRRGRPASRFRTLLRTALLWMPACLMLILVMYIDSLGPRVSLVASVMANILMAMPLLYAAAALAGPERSWHDRVAGTWLVPE